MGMDVQCVTSNEDIHGIHPDLHHEKLKADVSTEMLESSFRLRCET